MRRDEQESAAVPARACGEDVDLDRDEGSQNRHGELVLRWRQRIGREISELGDDEVEGEGVFADEEVEDLWGVDTWQDGGDFVSQCIWAWLGWGERKGGDVTTDVNFGNTIDVYIGISHQNRKPFSIFSLG